MTPISQKMTLNVPEVCDLLNLSRPTVMSFIHQKEHPMPCLFTRGKGRGRYVVPRALLERWIEEEADRCAQRSWR